MPDHVDLNAQLPLVDKKHKSCSGTLLPTPANMPLFTSSTKRVKKLKLFSAVVPESPSRIGQHESVSGGHRCEVRTAARVRGGVLWERVAQVAQSPGSAEGIGSACGAQPTTHTAYAEAGGGGRGAGGPESFSN